MFDMIWMICKVRLGCIAGHRQDPVYVQNCCKIMLHFPSQLFWSRMQVVRYCISWWMSLELDSNIRACYFSREGIIKILCLIVKGPHCKEQNLFVKHLWCSRTKSVWAWLWSCICNKLYKICLSLTLKLYFILKFLISNLVLTYFNVIFYWSLVSAISCPSLVRQMSHVQGQ